MRHLKETVSRLGIHLESKVTSGKRKQTLHGGRITKHYEFMRQTF